MKIGFPEVTARRYSGAGPGGLTFVPLGVKRGFLLGLGDGRILEKLDRNERASYDRRIASLAAEAGSAK